MLSRAHRLADRAAIRTLLSSRQRCWLPLVGLRISRTNRTTLRFVFIISTKVSKRAVERNRIRRHLREGIRQLLPQLASGHDVAIIATPAAKGASGPHLREQLTRAALRLGLLQAENPNTQALHREAGSRQL